MTNIKYASEADFVDDLSNVLPAFFRCAAPNGHFSREVGAGRRIADIAAVLSAELTWIFPDEPLTATESVLLATLRRYGKTRIDLLERQCGYDNGQLRDGDLERLCEWQLLTKEAGGCVASTTATWPIEVVAIEAKLTKWREALAQAVFYRRYANRSYVALPACYAAPALSAKDEFHYNGVGLLVLKGHDLTVEVAPNDCTDHDWRREFVVSRIVNSPWSYEIQSNGHRSHRSDPCSIAHQYSN